MVGGVVKKGVGWGFKTAVPVANNSRGAGNLAATSVGPMVAMATLFLNIYIYIYF